MTRDELAKEINFYIDPENQKLAAEVFEIIKMNGYALLPVATIKRLDQLYNTDEVAHSKAPEIETCLDELRAAVEVTT